VERLFEVTSKAERLAARRRVFAQQDGLALLPLLASFTRRRVFEALAEGIDVRELVRTFSVRRGYLHLALRAFASSGWLTGWSAPQTKADLEAPAVVKLTADGRALAQMLASMGPTLDRVEAFLAFSERMSAYLTTRQAAPDGVATIAEFTALRDEAFGLAEVDPEHAHVRARLLGLLEGGLAAPIAVSLARHGLVRMQGSGRDVAVDDEVSLSGLSPTCRRRVRDEVLPALSSLGWLDAQTQRLTGQGRATVFFAPAYAVTLSYLPLLRRAEELLFRNGGFVAMFPPTAQGHETHVDRRLNIWGSGGSHGLYFAKVDEIVTALFEREDYPRAVCDTGCGDGTFLRHIAEVLRDRLSWDFFSKPVAFIGADLNLASRDKTRETLAAGGVPHAHVVDPPIDIADPDALDRGIRALGIAGPDGVLGAADALHTNSMLIHNRIWRATPGTPPSSTDGAFVEPGGDLVTGQALAADLVAFMQRWSPYVSRYGWLFIELHTLPSTVVAEDPGRTPTIGYDLTHGFSNQYTVERAELLRAATLAGLEAGPEAYQALFPSGALARVSITYLQGARG